MPGTCRPYVRMAQDAARSPDGGVRSETKRLWEDALGDGCRGSCWGGWGQGRSSPDSLRGHFLLVVGPREFVVDSRRIGKSLPGDKSPGALLLDRGGSWAGLPHNGRIAAHLWSQEWDGGFVLALELGRGAIEAGRAWEHLDMDPADLAALYDSLSPFPRYSFGPLAPLPTAAKGKFGRLVRGPYGSNPHAGRQEALVS